MSESDLADDFICSLTESSWICILNVHASRVYRNGLVYILGEEFGYP